MAQKKISSEDSGGERKRLIVLDSHAILHRAYHALPDFTSSKGEPTGALYGLCTMLLRTINELKPDYIVATRDLPGGTHRHEVFEDYKGTRAKADDALVEQLVAAPRVFEAFGIPVYQAPGFEADDCIGTIVRELAAAPRIDTIIASGDMDTLQLVGDKVVVYTMRMGINDTILFDEEAVRERYGFGPELVPDLKGIMGDHSDNIPGVKGVGEGSAVKLLCAYPGLDALYAALKEKGVEAVAKKSGVQKRFVQLVADGEEAAHFSKGLATIRTDAPISFTLPEQEWRLADHEATVAQLCDELDFKSLKERVHAAVGNLAKAERRTEDISAPLPDIDPAALQETLIALWLLHSDTTNPGIEDVFEAAHASDFEIARQTIFKELRETGRLQEVYDEIEHPLIPIVERMKQNGVALDAPYLKKLAKEYNAELGKIAGRIFDAAGRDFNINSPKQLGIVLYDELKITPAKQKKTARGTRTTREEELLKLVHLHPVIADVLRYRELQKLLGTYVEKMPAMVASDGRLHATFLQAGAATGRMASENPGLQNIPIKTEYGRRIRNGFIAAPGFVLASIDYSQIELRIAAGLSGDTKIIEVFKSGGDIHAAVAAEVFGVPPQEVTKEMRRRAKVINFGILYGMGVNALRANLSEGGTDVSREESARYLSDYFKNFSGLREWIDATKFEAAKNGYTETLFGRRRYFPGFKSSLPGLVAQAERMAINAPIQGTQADIIKLAMVHCDKLIEKNNWREKVKLTMQVHDELVFEVAEDAAEEIAFTLKKAMEDAAPIEKLAQVPIVAEAAIGPNWGEMQKLV